MHCTQESVYWTTNWCGPNLELYLIIFESKPFQVIFYPISTGQVLPVMKRKGKLAGIDVPSVTFTKTCSLNYTVGIPSIAMSFTCTSPPRMSLCISFNILQGAKLFIHLSLKCKLDTIFKAETCMTVWHNHTTNLLIM